MSEVWAFAVGFLALVIGVMYYRQIYSVDKKRQAMFVILGCSIPIITAFFTQGIITPILQIKVPELTTIAFTGLCLCVGYAIFEHKLFVFTPATAAENIIETMNDSLFLVDNNERIMRVNPSLLNLLEYNKEELIGCSINKLFVEEQLGNDITKKLLKNQSFNNYETEFKTKSGKKVDVDFSGSVVKDDNGKITGIVGIAYDITERKRREIQLKEQTRELDKKVEELEQSEAAALNIMEDLQKTVDTLKETQEIINQQNIQLKKLDKIKSDFLNITSHELRTPMSAIKGYVQMVIKQKLGQITEEQQHALTVVLRNTDRLDNLIRDILDISRLESGTMKFVPEKTDAGKMVKEAIETMQPTAELKNINISTEVENDIPEMMVDHERIKQVIINIVNNAIKFSPKGTIINVRTKKDNDQVLFEIQDFGRGIPKDKQEKIFEIFYQVDSGMDRKFGGAGLGLAISRGIILSHGGNIWVESEPDKGSTFRFTLPIIPVQDLEGKFRDVDIFKLKDTKRAMENDLREKTVIWDN